MRATLNRVVKEGVIVVGISDIRPGGASSAKIQGAWSGQDDSTWKVPAASVTRAEQVVSGEDEVTEAGRTRPWRALSIVCS